jgi:hypothetical protein
MEPNPYESPQEPSQILQQPKGPGLLWGILAVVWSFSVIGEFGWFVSAARLGRPVAVPLGSLIGTVVVTIALSVFLQLRRERRVRRERMEAWGLVKRKR